MRGIERQKERERGLIPGQTTKWSQTQTGQAVLCHTHILTEVGQPHVSSEICFQ